MAAAKPSSKEVFQMIDAALKTNPSAIEGMSAVYQFNLTGDDGGQYQMIIDDGNGKAIGGKERKPDCTLEMDAEEYKDMVAGTVNPTSAFMSGQLKIEGDMGLALQLQNILYSFSS